MKKTFTVKEIQLHSLTYTKNSVAEEHQDMTTAMLKVDYRFQSVHNESKHQYKAILGAHLYGENIPYTLQIEMIGTFFFDSPPTQEEEHIFTVSTSPHILFPYLRETVSDVLRRAGYPSVYLHPINFQNATLIQKEQ